MKNIKIFGCAALKAYTELFDSEMFCFSVVVILILASCFIPFFATFVIFLSLYSFRNEIIDNIKGCWVNLLIFSLYSIATLIISLMWSLSIPLFHSKICLSVSSQIGILPYGVVVICLALLMIPIYMILSFFNYFYDRIKIHLPECKKEYDNKFTKGDD